MNTCTTSENLNKILELIKDRYECETKKIHGWLTGCYFDEQEQPGLDNPRDMLCSVTFNLKIELSENDLKLEAAKFTLTQAAPSWKTGPYNILASSSEFIPAYYLRAKYTVDPNHKSNQVYLDRTWRMYTSGDTIIGKPEIYESRFEIMAGKVGSLVTFKMTHNDLINYPVNIIFLERFLAKYCDQVNETSKDFIVKQIQGKGPLRHGKMMGMYLNYCGRTVTGPDPSLVFGETC